LFSEVQMLEAILRDLHQPEYVHVLINPLPVYGSAMGLIGLLAAICQRSRAATIAALLVVLISTAVAWPVYEYGEQAYDRVLSMADSDGQAWLATHRERAEHLIWCFYAVAVLSAIALIVPVKWPRSSLWLAAAVLVLGAITLGVGGYIATTTATSAARVTIRALKYSRQTIQIRTGETIEWANDDLTPHTVTSEGGGDLNSGSIDPGGSWRHTFSSPGRFPYFCTFHPEMKGVVVVQ
jgi:plastocyanin